MTDMEITLPANIILGQLGGKRVLIALLGAYDFFHSNNGNSLQFKFKVKADRSINHIEISLRGDDTYDVSLTFITRKKDKDLDMFFPFPKLIEKHEGIYADTMIELLEKETGLSFRMPRFVN